MGRHSLPNHAQLLVNCVSSNLFTFALAALIGGSIFLLLDLAALLHTSFLHALPGAESLAGHGWIAILPHHVNAKDEQHNTAAQVGVPGHLGLVSGDENDQANKADKKEELPDPSSKGHLYNQREYSGRTGWAGPIRYYR